MATFDEIIRDVTLADFKSVRHASEDPTALSFDEMESHFFAGKQPDKQLPASLTAEEQRKNIAVYAKLVREGVGFDDWPKKELFMEAITRLYNRANERKTLKEFADDLFECNCLITKTLDRHGRLFTGFEKGKNSAETKKQEEIENYEVKAREFSLGRDKDGNSMYAIETFDSNGHSRYEMRSFNRNGVVGEPLIVENLTEDELKKAQMLWEIGSIKQDDSNKKPVLLVRFPSLDGKDGSYEQWEGFIKTFDNIYGWPDKKNGQDWGRLILDVRGNGGGEDKPILHMAQRTFGNFVNSYKQCVVRDTAFGDSLLTTHGMYKGESCPKDLEVMHRQHFSGKNVPIFDQTEKYYTFNEKEGFAGSIDVLIDREVGSAAESAYTLFLHHPRVRFIGENTFGMQQYQQGWANLPCGFGLRVACTKLTYYDKAGENTEIIGHEPDIKCKSEDALQRALHPQADDVKPFKHELNIEIPTSHHCPAPNQINPYNPHQFNVQKSYYAVNVEPKRREIENQNINIERELNWRKMNSKI